MKFKLLHFLCVLACAALIGLGPAKAANVTHAFDHAVAAPSAVPPNSGQLRPANDQPTRAGVPPVRNSRFKVGWIGVVGMLGLLGLARRDDLEDEVRRNPRSSNECQRAA